ncbi:hypothetical protein A406_0549 [Listeria monocytogenes serotype 4b str. 81-0592]|nr:hypothetical protein A407_0546 [Listeria monocytogenes serotype 4b str. 81-0861]ASH31532.1 hypothetical protein A408_0550 [Listeria monocytogenes serotype 4b str. 10-0809]ASH77788.1 hypothetical protein A405_0540 [Listeria monocytogenes serotype 4b str. 81-0558]ASH80708.1 hypothetical protein A406_0549 [Listeria monocytogenes serotype 4b str. 81-0592]
MFFARYSGTYALSIITSFGLLPNPKKSCEKYGTNGNISIDLEVNDARQAFVRFLYLFIYPTRIFLVSVWVVFLDN